MPFTITVNMKRFGSTTLLADALSSRHPIYIARQDLDVISVEGGEKRIIREGHLLVPRLEKSTGEWSYYHYVDVNDAIRALVYSIAGYGDAGEGEVMEVRANITSMEWLLRTVSNYGHATDTERKAIDVQFAALKRSLSGKHDFHKAAARRNVKGAASLHDRTGRLNPGAARLALAHSRNGLDVRLMDIRAILPRVSAREMVLLNERDESIGILWDVRDRLKALLERDPHEWSEKGVSVQAVRDDLRDLIRLLGRLRAAPYAITRDFTVGDLHRALALLHTATAVPIRDFRREIGNAYNGVRSRLAGNRLEELHTELGLLCREVIARKIKRDEGVDAAVLRATTHAGALATELGTFSVQLAKLDDSKFVRRIFGRTRARLSTASTLLVSGELDRAKAAVKKALALL
jgi:hypothetical protein